jgi:cyanate permease
VVVACIAPLIVQDWPQTAKFLSEPEREAVVLRLKKDADQIEHKMEFKYIIEAFKNPKMYLMVLIYLGGNCGTYAIAFFLPTIINELGYSAATYTSSVFC